MSICTVCGRAGGGHAHNCRNLQPFFDSKKATPAEVERDRLARENASLRADVELLKSHIEKAKLPAVEWLDCRRPDHSLLQSEVERLRGITPEFPPMPPDGVGLPRYGIRWTGPQQPLAVPMSDGYWTPAHLAEAEVERLRAELRQLNGTPQWRFMENHATLRAHSRAAPRAIPQR